MVKAKSYAEAIKKVLPLATPALGKSKQHWQTPGFQIVKHGGGFPPIYCEKTPYPPMEKWERSTLYKGPSPHARYDEK